MSILQLVVTDRPEGKGFNPKHMEGYQLAACSDGIPPEQSGKLETICTHYGQVVYGNDDTIQQAKEEQEQWRKNVSSLETVPSDILKNFPIIYSYDQLDSDTFALTQIRYIGMTYDGRFGNFLSHSFIFHPKVLNNLENNPLTIDPQLFWTKDQQHTTLPTIKQFSQKNYTLFSTLNSAPYQNSIRPLITSLSTLKKPLLICIKNWQEGANLIRDLLYTLPSSLRPDVTFCAYEGDRNTAPQHNITVQCCNSSDSLKLMTDEYNKYAIFNFIDDKTCSLETSEYSQFVLDCLNDNKIELLNTIHCWIEKFNLIDQPVQWDHLVRSKDLFIGQTNEKQLAYAIEVFCNLLPQQNTKEGLDFIYPHIVTIAQSAEYQNLDIFSDSLQPFIRQVDDSNQEFVNNVKYLAEEILKQRGWANAIHLFMCCPLVCKDIIKSLLEQMQQSPSKGQLEHLLAVCTRENRFQQFSDLVLSLIPEHISSQQNQVLILARLAETIYDSQLYKNFFDNYQTVYITMLPDDQKNVRQNLARCRVSNLLSDKILKNLLPWEQNSKNFAKWKTEIFISHPHIFDHLCRKIADRLDPKAEEIILLAEHIIAKRPKTAQGPGEIKLLSQIAHTLPLEPLSPKWEQIIVTNISKLEENAQHRMQLIHLLTSATKESEKGSWSISEFLQYDTDNIWQTAKNLHKEDKRQIVSWCLSIFAYCNISSSSDAEGLVELLEAVGQKSPQSIAQAIDFLTVHRDVVTQVVAVTAFVRSIIEGKKKIKEWGPIISTVLKQLDKTTRKLFEDHIYANFGHRNREYDTRLLQVAEAAQLSKLKANIKAKRGNSKGFFSQVKNLFSSTESQDKSTPKKA